MTLTPTDITPGAIVTNGKGRFRLVTEIRDLGDWADVHYCAAYVNTKGKMKSAVPMLGSGDCCSPTSLLLWSTRLATPEERAEVVRVLNPKGVDHV